MTPEQIAELRAVWSRFVAEQTLSARTRVVDEFIGCRRISALLDAAERCGSLAIELQEVKRVDLEQMEWMSERINELDRRNDEQDRHRRKALADVYTLTADRDDLARRLGEATAALLALRKWIDEYSDLVERSKRWVHDSTMWETSSYPELAKEWQALWSRYPESVIDINTTPPADLAAVRGACALALRWLGDPDDPNGTFEDIGAWYQRETGRLRPGKSLPMAMAGDSQEEREKHFRAWADAKDREVRAALKSAGGASRIERGDHAKGGG